MKVLVIPDVHLKPWIFDEAAKILDKGLAKKAVFLGDLVDDWEQEYNIELYNKTLNRAIKFARTYPKTLWCYGNHDLSYICGMQQNGYSYTAQYACKVKLRELYTAICRVSMHNPPMGIVQKIDNIWFSHAGVTQKYADRLVGFNKESDGTAWAEDEDFVFNLTNDDNIHSLWLDDSPIWVRPEDTWERGPEWYKSNKIMQIVGHTPMKKITFTDNILYTDTFSTYQNGEQIGENAFAIIDTEKRTWEKVKI